MVKGFYIESALGSDLILMSEFYLEGIFIFFNLGTHARAKNNSNNFFQEKKTGSPIGLPLQQNIFNENNTETH